MTTATRDDLIPFTPEWWDAAEAAYQAELARRNGMTPEERAAFYACLCALPDRAAEIEAALAEKAKDLPIDTQALGY